MPKLFLTEEMMDRLLTSAAASPRDRALLATALATGLRAGDLAALLKSKVQAPDGTIMPSVYVRMRKTGKYVDRRLGKTASEAIACYLAIRGQDKNPFLFAPQSRNTRLSVGPMSRVSIHRIFVRYLSQIVQPAELVGNSVHTARRSTGRMIADKKGLDAAAAFLGHSDLSSCAFYLDMIKAKHDADAAVEEIFGK